MIALSFSTVQQPVFKKILIEEMRAGKIFIYPTDTIYGIGCNALNQKAVKKIHTIKKRDAKKPFSVISPSKKWINAHCQVRFPSLLSKIPGPYTFILTKKSPSYLKEVCRLSSLGVRMIDHPFQKWVSKAEIPFVTTSVNLTGQPSIRKIEEIPHEVMEKVDYVLDDGILSNPPSQLIDFSGEKPIYVKRKT